MKYKKALWYAVDGTRLSVAASRAQVKTIVKASLNIVEALIILLARLAIIVSFPISIPLLAWIIMADRRNTEREYDELLQQHNWNPDEH